ncbi:MAG: TatD family hydrolase [Syntrophomonadaceae bacterium]|nr:TatD family hydrolase [Syntrophomonadaceae bacterium]
MLFDSHAHLQSDAIEDKLEHILQRAREAEVEDIAVVGYDLPSSRQAVELARRHKMLHAVVGIHPHDAKTADEETLAEIMRLGKLPEVVAIGEMGLDYFRNLSPKDEQINAFRAQIKIAHELGKPIVIHDRDAHQEVLDILKSEKAGRNMGIMHCYSGHLPLAVELMKQGFYISIAGPVTYKNAAKTQEVAAKVPADRLLVETDCPYLSPEPFRGKTNEPARVRDTARKVAELRHKPLEEISYLTWLNARKVFGLG